MNTYGFDAQRFKAMERSGFNQIAIRYAQGAAMRSALTEALITVADLCPGQRVLDLASGPGLLAQAAAPHVLPNGWVLASDIAEDMLMQGRTIAAATLTPSVQDVMSYAAADSEQLCLRSASFDRILAGLALFMLPDPDQALRECHRILRPGGRIALSVWGTRESVPLISHAQDCIAHLLPQPRVARPSVFRFGKAGILEAALVAAGFSAVQITTVQWSSHFEDAAAYWQAFLDLAGGVTGALTKLAPATQTQLRTSIKHELELYRNPRQGGYTMTSQALVATALT